MDESPETIPAQTPLAPTDAKSAPPEPRSGFLSQSDAGAFRERGFHIPAGHHTLFTSATFEPPFFVNSGFGHFRGSIGAFSYSHSRLDAAQKIGRYCSIANGSEFGGTDHPTSWISSSAFSHNRGWIWREWLDATGETYEHHKLNSVRKNGDVEIGNDVWIGRGSWIRRGLHIGDGAVIGAHSVVTKDVEPFTIVAGNPARIVRQRFSDSTIARIQRVKWWDFKFTDFNKLPVAEPELFLDGLEERIARDSLKPYKPAPLTGAEIIALLRENPH